MRFGPWIIQPLDMIELMASLVLLAIALRAPSSYTRFAQMIRVSFARAARWRGIIIALAITPVLLRLLLATLPGFHFPRPIIPDELSYILAGDTFSHFRLANPQHPMWQFFDTFHVLSHPTYASKYPPGQGMALAAGKLLFGSFRAGVHLSIALLTVSVYWMLRGWVPKRWALLGAAIMIVRFGLFSYWMDSFWGGAVAATGGALVLGAFPRIMRSPKVPDSVIAALGAFILGISRPFEGALYCLPFAVALTWWLLRPPERVKWTRFAAPFVLIFGCGLAWMGYYNYRVTGSPLIFPHVLYAKQYQVQPYFRWQKPLPEPVYTRPELQHFWAEEEPAIARREEADPRVFHFELNKRVAEFVVFYFPMLQFGILVVALPRLCRREFVVLWAAAALPFCVSIFGSYAFFVHYLAPLTGVCVLFVVKGLQLLENSRFRDRPSGMIFAWSVPTVLVFMVIMRIVAYPTHLLILPDPFSWNHSGLDNGAAIPIEQTLLREPRKNLVFVRYTPGAKWQGEWIYNEADIDNAHTVWARDKGALNEPLIRYYPGRKVWLLEPALVPIRLAEYPGSESFSWNSAP